MQVDIQIHEKDLYKQIQNFIYQVIILDDLIQENQISDPADFSNRHFCLNKLKCIHHLFPLLTERSSVS